jgi:hypothetical protein
MLAARVADPAETRRTINLDLLARGEPVHDSAGVRITDLCRGISLRSAVLEAEAGETPRELAAPAVLRMVNSTPVSTIALRVPER